MPFAETALGIGALLGGAASAGSAISSGSLNRKNRKWQEKMYKWQLQDNRDNTRAQWQENRDYAKWLYDSFESPSAQRAAMKAAGINPFVQGSAIQPMSVQSGTPDTAEGGSVPSHGPYQNNPMSNIQAGASSLREFAMQQVQADNIRAQTEYTNAERLKVLAETKGLENTNSMFDIIKATAESELVSKRFKAVIDEVQARYAEANAISDVEQKQAKIAEINASAIERLANAAKTDADRLTVNYLREAQKRSLDTGSDLNEARIQTENALREGRVKLTEAQVNGVLADIGLSNAKKDAAYHDLISVLTGTQPASTWVGAARSFFRAVSSLATGTGRDLDDVEREFYQKISKMLTK